MNENIIRSAKIYIKDIFQNDFSGHDYYHSIRVYNLATRIAQHENADLTLVQLIALLHDVDDYKLFAQNRNFQNTRYFLNSHNIYHIRERKHIRLKVLKGRSFKMQIDLML